MKKGKLAVIVAAASALSCVAFAACSDGEEPAPEHTHVYGSWAITTAPTATTGGKITGTCADDNTKTVLDIPSLSDTSFWSKAENAAATGTDANTTYTNDAYGIQYVVYTHSYGAWQVQTGSAPTADDTGIAMRVCANHSDVTETMALPKLTDEFWTVKSTVPAGCTTAASTTYGNDTYNLTVTVTTGTPAGHTWGDWQIKTGSEPTADKAGTAIRYCTKDDGGSDTKTLPKLTDTTYWTATVKTEATCVDDEMTTYSNATDKLSLDVKTADKTGHDWSAWSWKDDVKPDHTKGGTLVRTCETDETHKDELEVAKLPAAGQSDANWDCTNVPADLNTAEYNVYASKQVSGLVIRKYEGAQKTAAVYDGKTYHSLSFQIQEGALRVVDSWSAAALTVTGGNMSVGTGEAYPYRGKFEFELVDCDTDKGELKLTKYDIKSSSSSSGGSFGWGDDDEYWELDPDADYDELSLYSVARAGTEYETTPSAVITAWIDWESGIIVTPGNSWSDINVLVPSDTALDKASFKASSVNGVMFISYTDAESHVHNIFIANNRAYLGGSFKDIKGEAVEADTCATSDWIYAYDKDNVKIKGYVKNDENEMVETDGHEGAYTYAGTGTTLGNVMVSGWGGIKIGSDDGYYVYESGKVCAIVNDVYYEITLTAGATAFTGTYDYVAPTVKVKLDFNGTTPTNAAAYAVYTAGEGKVVSKKVPIDFDEPLNAEKSFRGWYLDAACTQEAVVSSQGYVPTGDVTLYAKWASKITLTLANVKAGDETMLYIAEGDVYGDCLPYEVYEVDEATDKYFAGWYTDAGLTNEVTLTATAAAGDTGSTLYAKWVETPAYYGTYTGKPVSSSGIYTGGSSGLTMEISVDGDITGTATWYNTARSLEGKVVSYDADTQLLTWKPAGKDKNAYMILYKDATTKQRVVVFDDSVYDEELPYDQAFVGFTGTASSFDTRCYTVTLTDGYVRDARVIMYNNGTSDVTMFEYNNKLYVGVTFEDAAGNALATATAVHASKTLIVKQGGNKLFAIGSTGTNLSSGTKKPMDNVYGSYTDAESKALVLDGVGAGTYDSTTIQYTVNDGTVGFFTMSGSNKTAYYEATLTGATAAVTKPVVTITFDLKGKTVATAPETSYNKNLPVELPNLMSTDNYCIDGWYTDEDLTTAVTLTSGKYTPAANATLYAKWAAPVAVMGEYKGFNIYYSSSNAIKNTSQTSFTAKTLTVTARGAATGTRSGNVTMIDSNSFNLVGSKTSYYYYEPTLGIVLTHNTEGKDNTMHTDLDIMFKNSPTRVDYVIFNYGGKIVALLKVAYSDGDKWVAIVKGKLYSNITFEYTGTDQSTTDDLSKMGSTGSNLSKVSELIIRDSANNMLIDLVGTGSTLEEADDSKGTYTKEGESNIVLNGVDKFTWDTKSGTYSAVEGAAEGTYKLLVKSGSTVTESYTLVTDKAAKTYSSVTENKVNVSYDFGDMTDPAATLDASNVYTDVQFTLPDAPAIAGYIFRGWYNDADNSGSAVTKITPTEATTVYAKYDPAATVTWNYNDGSTASAVDNTKFKNDKVGTLQSVDGITVEGKAFAGWYTQDGTTTGEWGDAVTTNTVISGNVEYHAKWVVPAAMTGEYKGFNMDDAKESGVDKIVASQSYTFNIKATGEYLSPTSTTNMGSGILSDADMTVTDGTINIGKYAYVNKAAGMLWCPYSSSTQDSVNNDTNIFMDTSKVKSYTYSGMKGSNGTSTYVAWFTLTFNDNTTMNVFLFENRIYDNVTWTAGVSADQANNTNVTVYKDGAAIAIYKDGVFASYDGYQGYTFTGTLNGDASSVSFAPDGTGEAMLDSVAAVYDVVDTDTMKVVCNNRMIMLTVDKTANTFTQIQDGYQGSYTGAATLTLDGYGGAGSGKTYVISADGTKITVYDGGSSTTYGIDVTTKTLAAKSVFAGLAFTTSSDVHKVVFDDAVNISGTMTCGYAGWFVNFTGEIIDVSGGKQLECTVVSQTGTGASTGQKFHFNIVGDKLVFVESGQFPYASIPQGKEYTCSGFSLT